MSSKWQHIKELDEKIEQQKEDQVVLTETVVQQIKELMEQNAELQSKVVELEKLQSCWVTAFTNIAKGFEAMKQERNDWIKAYVFLVIEICRDKLN